MPTSYDEILYRGLPYNQTHPDRLATIATLFGMKPEDIAVTVAAYRRGIGEMDLRRVRIVKV